jgi:hypothetical protein
MFRQAAMFDCAFWSVSCDSLHHASPSVAVNGPRSFSGLHASPVIPMIPSMIISLRSCPVCHFGLEIFLSLLNLDGDICLHGLDGVPVVRLQ